MYKRKIIIAVLATGLISALALGIHTMNVKKQQALILEQQQLIEEQNAKVINSYVSCIQVVMEMYDANSISSSQSKLNTCDISSMEPVVNDVAFFKFKTAHDALKELVDTTKTMHDRVGGNWHLLDYYTQSQLKMVYGIEPLISNFKAALADMQS